MSVLESSAHQENLCGPDGRRFAPRVRVRSGDDVRYLYRTDAMQAYRLCSSGAAVVDPIGRRIERIVLRAAGAGLIPAVGLDEAQRFARRVQVWAGARYLFHTTAYEAAQMVREGRARVDCPKDKKIWKLVVLMTPPEDSRIGTPKFYLRLYASRSTVERVLFPQSVSGRLVWCFQHRGVDRRDRWAYGRLR